MNAPDKIKKRRVILLLLVFSLPVLSQPEAYTGKVKTIDIINWTHTDYGFTDHPLIVAELQKRYIDIALDFAEQTKSNRQGERFTWTVEALGPFWEWWEETTPSRREKMLQCIQRGQIDVNSMPFNIHPMLNDREIEKLTSWVPAGVASMVKSRIAVQNDVNGFSRSVANVLISKGIKYIWLGMNGRLPFDKPTACWWKMPEGGKIFLWCGSPYWAGYDWFHEWRWRTDQKEATNLMYRWPREGEIFKADEESVRKAHKICLGKLIELENKGYSYESLPLTLSNQWRCDNDGPFPGIVGFVKKWNELGLKPELNLTTATHAMESLENTAAGSAVEINGEFGDWWAFGMAAMPRETAVARAARHLLQAARSPVFKGMTKSQNNRADEIERDICTYYEHTFAASHAGKDMYSTQNQGSINEAFRHAYKAYEYANWLLAQQARSFVDGRAGGLYIINTQQKEYSGWCEVSKFISGGWWGATAIPGDYYSTAAEITRVEDTPHSVVYSQKLNNDRLNSAERVLTVYKNERRINIKIVFDRKLHTEQEQEVIYAEFPFHNVKREVVATNGGMEFTPYADHVPNTCKSYFVVDSWVKFASKEGTWLWSSKTSPIFELGKHMFFKKGDIKEPDNSYLLQSMLYNNAWTVNFPAEYTGKTVCEYDIYYSREDFGQEEAKRIADTYLIDPVVIVNPDEKEDDSYNRWLNMY